MQEIKHDIIEDPGKFSLIALPCTAYQKKTGEVPVPKEGLLSRLVEKYPNLPMDIGSTVEKYGNCPSIMKTIADMKTPTKFCTFPVSPTSLRVQNPDNYVFRRLIGRFKKPYSLLPGWTLVPRSDMVEFSAIKLAEIMRFYKLSNVAIPFELFTFDREDKDDYTRIKNIICKYIKEGLYLVSRPSESTQGTIISNIARSTVTFEE